MAGTDCGFAQSPFAQRVHPQHHVGEAALAGGRREDRVRSSCGEGGVNDRADKIDRNTAQRPTGGYMRILFALGCALLAWTAAALPTAFAQADFPSRPITIVVPFPPGGSSDTVTRLVAQKFGENLKTNVVIDNRGGGGGVPAAVAFKQAPPDGYSLFLANNGVFAIMPALTPNIQFDPVKDFAPVTPLFAFPSVLVVPAGSPAKSAKELVALAKTKAGGAQLWLAGRRLGRSHPRRNVPAGLRRADDARAVSRRRSCGERPRRRQYRLPVQLLRVGDRPGRSRQAAGARLDRDQALAGASRCSDDGGGGLPGTELEIWQGIVAPAGTPAAIVRKLNAEFVKAAQSPEVVSKVAAQAVDITTCTPEEFAKLIASDVERLGKVIRDAGIKSQ